MKFKSKILSWQITRVAFLLFTLLMTGCTKSDSKTLRVAASSVPHAQILEQVKEDLSKKGITLKIIEVDDYNIPNRLLYEGQVDANFFQHAPFLQIQNHQFGYDLVELAKVHIEPMGIYSRKLSLLSYLPHRSLVAIPNDPTNEARALKLLEAQGLIVLKDKELATPLDIISNPKDLHFEELDAALLTKVLCDVEIAVIPSNFALQADLRLDKEALVYEAIDSPYANVIAVRKKDQAREEFQELINSLHSKKLHNFILGQFKHSILPAFN